MTEPRKANFFLIGAAKAGTTSLDRLLRQHPQVFLSPIKEPCHFCPDINAQIRAEAARQAAIRLDAYLDAGCPEIVHQHLVERPEDYARLFAAAPSAATVLGECTTFYLISREAPALVHAYDPDAHIVAILRDPVARIRSHYAMDKRTGLERRGLDECLREEISLGAMAHNGNSRLYLATSDYAGQINRWRAVFHAGQMLVIDFLALVEQTDATLDRLWRFLGIAPPAAAPALGRENAGDVKARFGALDRALYRLGLKERLRQVARRILPRDLRVMLKWVYLVQEPTEPTHEAWQDWPEVKALVARYHALVREETTAVQARHD